MAIALIANTIATPGANGGSTSAIDTTGATLIVVLTAEYLGGIGHSVSDSKGNTWTPLTQQQAGAGLYSRVRIYYTIPTSVGSGHTFTFSGSGGHPVIMVQAFSGTKSSGAFDAENGASTNSAGTLSPGSITPSEDNCVVTQLVCNDNLGAMASIDGSYVVSDSTGAVGGTNVAGTAAYKVQTTATATNPTWTLGGTADAAAAAACFKSDGAAPSTNTSQFFMTAGAS